MEDTIKEISVGPCRFCGWTPQESDAKFTVVDDAVYVFCPKCGYENHEARFLIKGAN